MLRMTHFSLAMLIMLTGCSATDQGAENSQNNTNVMKVKNSAGEETDRNKASEVSNRLEGIAKQVPHVNDATAIVFGNYAIVGIDIDSDIERSQVGTIKYSVGESFQKDPYGKRATIVADPDLNARIKEAAEDIKNGNPIRGILNELADITSRIIPEIPGDSQNPTPNKSIEEQKNNLNNTKEENTLEREQEKQSNGLK